MAHLTLPQYLADCRPAEGLGEVVSALAATIQSIAGQVDRAALAAVAARATLAPLADAGDPGGAGGAGQTNVHGETQQPLDLIGNDLLIRALSGSSHVAALASEELTDVVVTPGAAHGAAYIVAFDPLDGSSNIDVNVGVGTIFSIRRRAETAGLPTVSEFLQPGSEQVAAGFALYGPSTALVLSLGAGTDGFTLDRASGEFVLTHPQLQVPVAGGEYAINGSNERFWEPPVRRYVDECRAGLTGPREQDFNTRWVASLVAETYRILTRGGVFLYPRDTKDPSRAGRLRSVYECQPIGYLIEQAGGRVSTGRARTLDLRPASLHERAPLIFGSRAEVERLERYHHEFDHAPEHAPSPGSDQEPRPGSTFDASLFNVRSLFRVS